eukprot:s3558_g2.t1
MSNLSLKVIEARSSEIAAVLVNPLQCFHLNQSPPSDPVLSSNNRKVGPTPGYKEWLHRLRDTCKQGGIPLIFDEVYTGFRLHPRGAQGAYDVKADIVCYGKTLGGGLPIGVVCGPADLMARGDAKKAARVNYGVLHATRQCTAAAAGAAAAAVVAVATVAALAALPPLLLLRLLRLLLLLLPLLQLLLLLLGLLLLLLLLLVLLLLLLLLLPGRPPLLLLPLLPLLLLLRFLLLLLLVLLLV